MKLVLFLLLTGLIACSGSSKDATQTPEIKKKITESVKIEIKKMIKRYSHKDVVQFISKKENLPKKIIYEYCLKLKKFK